MAQNSHPKISIIIVNWNGKKWLKGCFDSILSQTYTSYEVIFVDNGSIDDSVSYLKSNFPKVKIIQLDKNYGFAKANNIGIGKAKGDVIFLLNNDTKIQKNMLEKIMPIFKNPKIGTIQPKIVLMNEKNKLDLVGAFWTPITFLYYLGLEGKSSLKRFNLPMKVFSNKGAAMFIRKTMIDKIGAFDDDFWSYYEETDLCHRAWISGYECWYYPVSTCYHANGGTSLNLENSFIQFHNFKNKLLSFLKNFETWTLLSVIPLYTAIIFGLISAYIVKGKYSKALALLKSLVWNLKNIRSTLKKRKSIQNNRIVKDHNYLSITSRPFSALQLSSFLFK